MSEETEFSVEFGEEIDTDGPVLINFRANYLEIVVSKVLDSTVGRRGTADRPVLIIFRANYLEIVVSKVLGLDSKEERSSR
jgi:hypothetical protein